MANYSLLMCMPMLLLLVWAACEDLRSRRIPNWLSFAVLLSGLIQSYTATQTVAPKQAWLGFLVGFGLPSILFALGALGGGDVKLLAGVGAWLGPNDALWVFALAAIVGMFIVLTQATKQGRMKILLRNSAVVAINLAHVGDVGLEHTTRTGQESRSVDRPLPYAVPILAATLLVILFA
jgi:prepilin peptidase CpaA